MVGSSRPPHTTRWNDIAESSTSTWHSNLSESSVKHNTREIDVVDSMTNRAELLPPSQPDHASLRSIPLLTMRSWMTKGFSNKAVVEDTYHEVHGIELMPSLTKEDSMGGTSPEPQDSKSPQPV